MMRRKYLLTLSVLKFIASILILQSMTKHNHRKQQGSEAAHASISYGTANTSTTTLEHVIDKLSSIKNTYFVHESIVPWPVFTMTLFSRSISMLSQHRFAIAGRNINVKARVGATRQYARSTHARDGQLRSIRGQARSYSQRSSSPQRNGYLDIGLRITVTALLLVVAGGFIDVLYNDIFASSSALTVNRSHTPLPAP